MSDWTVVSEETAGASPSPTDQWGVVEHTPTDPSVSAAEFMLKDAARQKALQEASSPSMFQNVISGGAETVASMGTGLVGQTVGGLRGLYDLATGKGVDAASANVQDIGQALTYAPRTQAGQSTVETIGGALDTVNKGVGVAGGAAGEAVNGEQGRIAGESIGEALIPVVSTLVGAPPAMKGATAASTAIKAAKAAKEAEKMVALADKSYANAPKIDAAKAAQRYGIKLNPAEVDPTLSKTSKVWLAGERELNEQLHKLNEVQVAKQTKLELGISDKVPLTKNAAGFNPFDAGRKVQGKKYEAIKEIGAVPNSYFDNLVNDVNNITSTEGMSADAIALMQKQLPANLEQLIALAGDKGLTGADVLTFTSQLRKEVNAVYKSGASGPIAPDALAVADAKTAISRSLENSLLKRAEDLAVSRPEFKDVVKNFKDARTYMAKSHAYENATDLNTGVVDVGMLARQTKNGANYTGFLRDVGHITGNFPNVMKPQPKASMMEISKSIGGRYSVPVMAGTAIATATGGPAFAALGFAAGVGVEKVASMLARKKMSSEVYQKAMKVEDFRSPEAVPMTFHKPAINTTTFTKEQEKRHYGNVLKQFNQEDYRGLLAFSDDLEKAAVKSQAKDLDMVDFPLRQEVLQYEEVAKATKDFVRESERLKGLMIKSQGFWKSKYADQLQKLEGEFLSGMEQLGISSAQDATGLSRKLYDAGGKTSLPIVKTK